MFLGLDLGTGSVKALLLDDGGRVVSQAARPYPVLSAAPGQAETPPEAWWERTVEAVRTCCAGRAAAVRGIGLSGQAHGIVLVGDGDRPLRPAMLWPDTRMRRQVEEMLRLPEPVRLALCNPVVTGMAATALLWLRAHEAGVLRETRCVLSPKDWLRLRLTGERATEPSDASMTLLYDMVADGWSEPVLAAIGLDPRRLAPLVASTAVAGHLRASAARAIGLPAGLPVAAGLADSAACLFGLGLARPGTTVLQVGSGIQLMTLTERVVPALQPFYNSFRGAGGVRYRMAALLNGGTAFEWVRGVLGASWEEMYEAAFAPGAHSGGALFLPYAAGERAPLLDPEASASWSGLRLGCGRREVIRATFEGIALAVRDSWEALRRTGVAASEILVTGGGSGDARWRQLLADTIGVSLRPVADRDHAAIGAAYLGGIAAGHWPASEAAAVTPLAGELVSPRETDELPARLERFRATYRQLRELG